MRKVMFLFSLLLVIAETSSAQKPIIDTATFDRWPTINNHSVGIANNGKFFHYSISNQSSADDDLIIQSLSNTWSIDLPGAKSAIFTNDSRYAIFLDSNSRLCQVELGTKNQTFIPKVKSFKLFFQDTVEWLAYEMNDSKEEFALRNLSTMKECVFQNVHQYILSKNGNILAIKSSEIGEANNRVSIKIVNIRSQSINTIWRGVDPTNIIIDAAGKQVAFVNGESENTNSTSFIWYYKVGMDSARELVNRNSQGIDSSVELDGISGFSEDGNLLFVNLRERALPQINPQITKLTIWSYFDVKLQSQQSSELEVRPLYLASVDLNNPTGVRRLQRANENISFGSGAKNDKFVIVSYRRGAASEYYWNSESQDTTYLVSCVSGDRTMLPIHEATLSPGGKYVIGFGPGSSLKNIFCYNIKTRVTVNITGSLPIPQQDKDWDLPLTNHFRGLDEGPWMANDMGILIYDSYDIWLVDPAGKERSRNLTKGRQRNMVYRLAKTGINKDILIDDTILLKSFNTMTKESGFNELDLKSGAGVKYLFMGPYLFEGLPDMQNQHFPVKARDANVFLVSRERADESPNIFSTTNFKKFTLLTAAFPEKHFNWLTSQLISFKTGKNVRMQGVLYKPENFDPTQKYPLLINYYEKKSDETYHYPKPGEQNGALDVPWFVSRGYLVLLQDIHFKIGMPGESVKNAIVSAAIYLSKFPWVDKRHIGIQGHSFGGYETNYLVTHSSFFAAAVTSSGESDLTSEYGTLWGGGASQQEYQETRDGRLGTTPWDNPEVYVKNSPVYYTGAVVTPILIVHNKNDQNVHFEQGLEFFTALRRAGKRVWMIQYDNGGHGLAGMEYKDYVIRMTQFFDHYLKGVQPPKWMTQGIPAARKGIDDGLELDRAVKTPGPGLKIDKAN